MRIRLLNVLIMSTALVAVVACSSDGPGEIGSKGDIFVRNAGEAPPPPSSTISEAAVAPQAPEGESMQKEMAAPAPAPAPASAPAAMQAVEAPRPKPVIEGDPAISTADKEAYKEEMAKPVNLRPQPILEGDPATMPAKPPKPAPAPKVVEAEPEPVPAPEMEEPEMVVEPSEPAVAVVPSAPVVEETVTEDMQPEAEQEAEMEADSAFPKAVRESVKPMAMKPEVVTGVINNPDAKVITAVQEALKARGYYFGVADGTMGAETLNAIMMYQNANKLKGDGRLTHETLQSLGFNTSSY